MSRLSPAERMNLPRWPGDAGGLNESLFFKFHLEDGAAFWARYTLRRPAPGHGGAGGALWAVYANAGGLTGGCDPFPAGEVAVAGERFWLRIGPGELSTGRATGQVTTPAGPVSWDLRFETGGPCLVHLAPEALYGAPLPRNKIVSPHVSTRFSGRLTVAGREIAVDRARGMQGHNWGPTVAPWWAWGHCNTFEGEPDTAFEAVTSRVDLGPVRSPPLSIVYLRARGREVLWNNAVEMVATRSRVDGLRWTLRTPPGRVRLEAEIEADPARTLGLGYRSSDGTTLPCWNSNLARARVVVHGLGNGPIELRSAAGATLELGAAAARGADIPMTVVG